jgi:hypothetical protein
VLKGPKDYTSQKKSVVVSENAGFNAEFKSIEKVQKSKKKTETEPKQNEFRFVSVQTETKIVSMPMSYHVLSMPKFMFMSMPIIHYIKDY